MNLLLEQQIFTDCSLDVDNFYVYQVDFELSYLQMYYLLVEFVKEVVRYISTYVDNKIFLGFYALYSQKVGSKLRIFHLPSD